MRYVNNKPMHLGMDKRDPDHLCEPDLSWWENGACPNGTAWLCPHGQAFIKFRGQDARQVDGTKGRAFRGRTDWEPIENSDWKVIRP